jgi:putative PIN family toxin of toxin-antitoxin system
MVKVVADTNIYISALFWRGNPYKFIHLCFEGKARLVISRQIIDELERILLTDKKFVIAARRCGFIFRNNHKKI